MKLKTNNLLLGLLLVASVSAIPKPEEKESSHHSPLEKDHANKPHFEGGHDEIHEHHNPQYDHEQFLGEDEAKSFDDLDPEESQRRLGIIADKIDEDKDGLITVSELRAWIQYTQRRYINDDVGRSWKQHNIDNNETIPWEVYRDNVYGFIDDMTEEELEKDENGITYKQMLNRDKRRWKTADQNGDNALNLEEFTAFLHPEDHATMRDVVLVETIEDIDKNKDGKISLEEYIGDVYKADSDDEEEPEWVKREREVFQDFRDNNKDGFLDREEMRAWIQPNDFDHAEAEAKHLVFEADENHDEKLTKEEILDKYDLFVGSQATDFGEALARHDEF